MQSGLYREIEAVERLVIAPSILWRNWGAVQSKRRPQSESGGQINSHATQFPSFKGAYVPGSNTKTSLYLSLPLVPPKI